VHACKLELEILFRKRRIPAFAAKHVLLVNAHVAGVHVQGVQMPHSLMVAKDAVQLPSHLLPTADAAHYFMAFWAFEEPDCEIPQTDVVLIAGYAFPFVAVATLDAHEKLLHFAGCAKEIIRCHS